MKPLCPSVRNEGCYPMVLTFGDRPVVFSYAFHARGMKFLVYISAVDWQVDLPVMAVTARSS